MKNILLFLASLFFAETVLQIVCQVSPTVDSLVFKFSDKNRELEQVEPIKIFDGPLGRRGNPKHPDHDQRGYRNKPGKNTVDIVAIGDSHTYGTSVDRNEAWPFLLQERSEMTTYNMGFGGYGPAQYLLQLDEAITLSPQLIIIGIYFGNDFYDNFMLALTHPEIAGFLSINELNTIRALEDESKLVLEIANIFQSAKPEAKPKPKPKVEPEPEENEKVELEVIPKLEPNLEPNLEPKTKPEEKVKEKVKPAVKSEIKDEETKSGIDRARVYLSDNSALYGLARALKDIAYAMAFPQPTVLSENFELAKSALTQKQLQYFSVFEGDKSWRTILTSNYRNVVGDRQEPRIEIGFQMTPRILAAIKQRVLSSNTQLLVVLLPTKESVFSEKVLNPDSHAGYPELIDSETRSREELKLFLAENEIPTIDLLPHLMQSDNQPYFSNADGHPNALGHSIISDVILKRITETELLQAVKDQEPPLER
jgi:hypothetical protein